MVGGAAYNPAALALIFDDEEAAQKFGLDWSRAAGAYEDHDHHAHDHDCDCGHDHAYDVIEDEADFYDVTEGFPEAFGGFSSN